ncbi:MAG: hypothetical protein KJ579_07035, partial [Verrucomicrobia bacterium]|nr:hypothetical protein [Verrucomicrobiota bacterium]
PATPTGKGAPVSDALTISPTGAHGKDLREALIAIDSVHGDGKLPPLVIDQSAGAGNLGVYVSTWGGEPVRIGVRPATKGGSHVLMTTAHEVGHFLDQQAFGLSGGKFASEKSPAFAAWRSAVDKSAAVATMLQAAPPAQVAYYKSYREMWARSYAQFIAMKSQDQRMLVELSKTLNEYGSWRQWAAGDFAAVAAEIEKILKAEGWM